MSLTYTKEVYLPTLMTFVPLLLKSNPEATTGFLIKLCKGDYASLKMALVGSSIKFSSKLLSSHEFIGLSLEEIFHAYVDYDDHLRVLIEGVYDGGGIKGFHQRTLTFVVANTILELYLKEYEKVRLAIESETESRKSQYSKEDLKSIEVKILSILDGHPDEYDIDRAMILVHTYDFENGSRYLLERTLQTELLLRVYIETNNDAGIMKILRREGHKHPELFVQVLTYFVKKSIEDFKKVQDNGDSDEEEEM